MTQSSSDLLPPVPLIKSSPIDAIMILKMRTAQPKKPSHYRIKQETAVLSQQQLQISEAAQNGDSVFYTGSAGTGKSVLLKNIIRTLRLKFQNDPEAVAVTALTGSAACNIGGITLHSFTGIGLGTEPVEVLVKKIRQNSKAYRRWLNTKVLVIDEVSMLDAVLFDKLARIGSLIRKTDGPFGAIQIIATGDFFQLPPVAENDKVTFAFEANAWKEVMTKTFHLRKIFRQQDSAFVEMLQELRFGIISPKTAEAFKQMSRSIETSDGPEATELFARRQEVEYANSKRLRDLKVPLREFVAVDGGATPCGIFRDRLLSNFLVPKVLLLGRGAQVMLVRNTSYELVNGTVGTVTDFVDPKEHNKGSAKLLPEVTNSEVGMTDEPGLLYPLIQFRLPNGETREVIVEPQLFKIELPSGVVQASRAQIPLILAWAMSIHKAQGKTLSKVKVDLRRVFEKGQAYVALSRATHVEGLQVLNFNPDKVKAHPKVVAWSTAFETEHASDIESAT